MPATTDTGNAILDLLLRGVSMTPPGRVWVSLHTDDPGNDGAHEVSVTDWPSYTRMDPADGGDVESGFLAPSEKGTVNANDLFYPTFDGSEPLTITHFGCWTAESNGSCVITGILALGGSPAPKTLLPTDEVVIRAGNMLVTVD